MAPGARELTGMQQAQDWAHKILTDLGSLLFHPTRQIFQKQTLSHGLGMSVISVYSFLVRRNLGLTQTFPTTAKVRQQLVIWDKHAS